MSVVRLDESAPWPAGGCAAPGFREIRTGRGELPLATSGRQMRHLVIPISRLRQSAAESCRRARRGAECAATQARRGTAAGSRRSRQFTRRYAEADANRDPQRIAFESGRIDLAQTG